MQRISRFRLMRRILFPYSGEDALTFWQGMRVILAWILYLPLIISLLALAFAALEGASVSWLVEVFAFAFISGACIFGLLGWLIVLVNNRSARIRRAWKAQGTRDSRQ
jgi:hypothetical protein